MLQLIAYFLRIVIWRYSAEMRPRWRIRLPKWRDLPLFLVEVVKDIALVDFWCRYIEIRCVKG